MWSKISAESVLDLPPTLNDYVYAATNESKCTQTCAFLKAVITEASVDFDALRGAPVGNGSWKGRLQPSNGGECVVASILNQILTYQCKMAQLDTTDEAQQEYDELRQAMSVALGDGWAFKEEKLLRSWRYEAIQTKTGMKAMLLVMDLRIMGGKIRVDLHVLPKMQ